MYEDQQYDAAMEQQQQETPYPLVAPPMGGNQMSEGLLEYQLEVQEIVEELMHSIKCEQLLVQPNGQKIWKTTKGMKPMINNLGVTSLSSELKPRLTKIFVLSDLDEETINTMVIDLARTIKDDFYDNWDIYKIRDTSSASKMLHLICDTYYATLRKAYLGGYLKFLKTTTQEIQHHQTSHNPRVQQQSQPQGRRDLPFIGKFLGRR